MTTKQIKKAAKAVLGLAELYGHDSAMQREMRLDLLLLGFFEARFGRMSRQTKIWISGTSHPKRVDFRHGGTNPVLMEFAVRPPSGASELYGPSNRSELNKLTRFPPSKAKKRVLLLFDLKRKPIPKKNLTATYARVRSSRGRFNRYYVRVIYVHRASEYDFSWGSRRT